MTGMMVAAAAAALAIAAAPIRQDATCPAGSSAALPATYDGWTAMQGVTAGTSVATPATLALGRSARTALSPVAAVTFPVKPERAAAAGTQAGVLAVDVTTAGTYRVALGAAVWVDLVAGGEGSTGMKALTSVAHGHGPECSTVRKFVDFKLTPGRYVLQVSGAKTPTLAVMVTRLG